jgi:hypothetical protein
MHRPEDRDPCAGVGGVAALLGGGVPPHEARHEKSPMFV